MGKGESINAEEIRVGKERNGNWMWDGEKLVAYEVPIRKSIIRARKLWTQQTTQIGQFESKKRLYKRCKTTKRTLIEL